MNVKVTSQSAFYGLIGRLVRVEDRRDGFLSHVVKFPLKDYWVNKPVKFHEDEIVELMVEE